MNNFYKFGQNSLSNYQIWQCYILFTKALKMMFQKLKSLFLKTWLLTKVFKRRWNITNSKLQTTPGFEGIKQLERLKTWSPALTMICGMLKENPSQCHDFKSNKSTGSTTVNTMLNYWQVNFWHLIYWTALHLLPYIVLLAKHLTRSCDNDST